MKQPTVKADAAKAKSTESEASDQLRTVTVVKRPEVPRNAVGSKKPNQWPEQLPYLIKPVYSRAIALRHLNQIHQLKSDLPADAITFQDFDQSSKRDSTVRIRRIDNPLHPAHRELGLFAARHLKPDTFLCLYLGYIHTTDPADNDNDTSSSYDIGLDNDAGVAVDANLCGNETRFINDYRGIRPAGPNSEFRECWVRLATPKSVEPTYEKCTGAFVRGAGKAGKLSAGIAKDEEIVVSYGKGFWRARGRQL